MFARRIITLVLCSMLCIETPVAYSESTTKTLPAGTKIYLVTDQVVSSKRGEADVGTIVPCRIWRDVELTGTAYIKGGTVAGCRVEKVTRRNMGGKEGKIAIGAIETKSIDGQQVILQGGYNKEGAGHKAVVWTVGLLLLWPVLFVPGGNAELPPGTVFDASTVNDLRIAEEAPQSGQAPRLDLSGIADGYEVEILLDEFLKQEKPEVLKIKLTTDTPFPKKFSITTVNGKQIDPLVLKMGVPVEADESATAVGEVKIKPLAKHFQKGINRFEVSYGEGDMHKSREVILDVQM